MSNFTKQERKEINAGLLVFLWWYFKLSFWIAPKFLLWTAPKFLLWTAPRWGLMKLGYIDPPLWIDIENDKQLWESWKAFCREIGLYAKESDCLMFASVVINRETDEHRIFLPSSVSETKVEKNLPEISRFLNRDFVHVEAVGDGEAKHWALLESKLPDIVRYEERPNVGGFWLGTDDRNQPVSFDFGTSPVMLITGASGSGKSVLARVLLEEANNQGYMTKLVDGKGGVDWSGIEVSEKILDFEAAAVMYEELLETMNSRLAELLEYREQVGKPTASYIDANMQPILCFMDEASDFFTIGSKSQDKNYAVKYRIVDAVSELARKSRAVGIFQVFSLQASKADSVPEDVKNNAGFRISYALPTAAMSQTLFESSIAFDPTLRKGKGVFKGTEGEPFIFRGAFIE